MRPFKTNRVAKLLPTGELQFTLGATTLGEAAGLNDTIRRLILDAGVEPIEGRTTAGNKMGSGEYPAVQIADLSAEQLAALLHRIEGAAVHVSVSAI